MNETDETDDRPATWIPATQAVCILLEKLYPVQNSQQSVPMYIRMAQRMIEDAIEDFEIAYNIDKVDLYHDRTNDQKLAPKPFETLEGLGAKRFMLATRNHALELAYGSIRKPLNDDEIYFKSLQQCLICGQSKLEFSWDSASDGGADNLDVWIKFQHENELIISAARNITVIKEEMLWLAGMPEGIKPGKNSISRGGRPAKLGMEDALIYLIVLSNKDVDGLIGKSQAEIVNLIAKWFSDNAMEEPARSTIELRARKIVNLLNQNTA